MPRHRVTPALPFRAPVRFNGVRLKGFGEAFEAGLAGGDQCVGHGGVWSVENRNGIPQDAVIQTGQGALILFDAPVPLAYFLPGLVSSRPTSAPPAAPATVPTVLPPVSTAPATPPTTAPVAVPISCREGVDEQAAKTKQTAKIDREFFI